MKLPHLFLVILATATWGTNFSFVKLGLQELSPFSFCFLRFFLVSLGCLFFKPPSVPFFWVVLYGIVMFVIQFSLVFFAIQLGLPAGLTSLVQQIQVFFSLFFAAFIFKETICKRQFIGFILASFGILLIALQSESSVPFFPLLLCIGGAATWGLGSVIVKKMGAVSSKSLLSWSSLVVWPILLLFSLFLEEDAPVLFRVTNLSFTTYAALSFVTLFSTIFAFGVWNWLLQVYPLAMVAPFTLLVPVFGLAASFFLLKEPLELWKMGASLLVLSGLFVNVSAMRLGTSLKKVEK